MTAGAAGSARSAAEVDDADPSLAGVVHRRLVDERAEPTELADRAAQLVHELAPLLPPRRAGAVVRRVLSIAAGLGPLDDLLADPSVSEVMVNGPGTVWIERAGKLETTDVVLDLADIGRLVERVVGPLGLRADRAHPVVDARLADGSRVNVVVPPLAIDGPCVTIRRFGAVAVDLDAVCPPGVAPLLRWAVASRSNIVVVGGTGAGKTTLLNGLAAHLPPGERVITIEDTAELRLPGRHVIRLEARPPNGDGYGGVSIRELVRNALRMRPDRIVVGEVRGPEALDMVQAMNTGHEGSLSTCHANSPADALSRLETMVLQAAVGLPLEAVRRQLAASVDLVVQVARTRRGRRVVAVGEVESAARAGRMVTLATDAGLVRLPARRRAAGHPPPDPAWLVPCER